jgi:arabinose-5-phosphate isomerase
MGDALAVALLEARGFTQEDFARSHPGGALGRRLLLKISDLMHQGERRPRVGSDTPLRDALLEMTRKGLGLTAIVDEHDRVLGIFTDGDLRRVLDQGGADALREPVGAFMTRHSKTIPADTLAAEALRVMQENKINALLVTNAEGALEGVLNMHDLLKARVI